MNLKLLILDETASRIDQHTELVVENALKNILKIDWL
jgi:ABC-type transport system involved in cytochrome bd biosynthesis fused ATPase/permease subunit